MTEESALSVIRALERMGVRYYVTGSLASSIHGDPRATNDADIVAALALGQFARLQEELGERFLVDPDEFRHAVLNERSFNLVDATELTKVDVFCVRDLDYQREALSRAQVRALQRDDPFSEVRVASVDDVVLSKLRWYRLGGEVSDRQWNDLRGVVRFQRAKLDLAYLREWSQRQGTADLLDRLLAK